LLLGQGPAGQRAHVVAGGEHAEFDALDLAAMLASCSLEYCCMVCSPLIVLNKA
jgi:hypothetical protein